MAGEGGGRRARSERRRGAEGHKSWERMTLGCADGSDLERGRRPPCGHDGAYSSKLYFTWMLKTRKEEKRAQTAVRTLVLDSVWVAMLRAVVLRGGGCCQRRIGMFPRQHMHRTSRWRSRVGHYEWRYTCKHRRYQCSPSFDGVPLHLRSRWDSVSRFQQRKDSVRSEAGRGDSNVQAQCGGGRAQRDKTLERVGHSVDVRRRCFLFVLSRKEAAGDRGASFGVVGAWFSARRGSGAEESEAS